MTEEFVAVAIDPEEREAELSLRPRNIDEFVGQSEMKEHLGIVLQAAARAKRADRPPAAQRAPGSRQDDPRSRGRPRDGGQSAADVGPRPRAGRATSPRS